MLPIFLNLTCAITEGDALGDSEAERETSLRVPRFMRSVVRRFASGLKEELEESDARLGALPDFVKAHLRGFAGLGLFCGEARGMVCRRCVRVRGWLRTRFGGLCARQTGSGNSHLCVPFPRGIA